MPYARSTGPAAMSHESPEHLQISVTSQQGDPENQSIYLITNANDGHIEPSKQMPC